jgi:hypothetical protein
LPAARAGALMATKIAAAFRARFIILSPHFDESSHPRCIWSRELAWLARRRPKGGLPGEAPTNCRRRFPAAVCVTRPAVEWDATTGQFGRPRTIGRRASRRARDKCARRTARVVVAVAGDVSRRRSLTSPFTLFPQPMPELDAPRERGFRRLERNGWRNVCDVRGLGAVCRFGETKPVLRCKSSGRYRVSRAGFQPDRGQRNGNLTFRRRGA